MRGTAGGGKGTQDFTQAQKRTTATVCCAPECPYRGYFLRFNASSWRFCPSKG